MRQWNKPLVCVAALLLLVVVGSCWVLPFVMFYEVYRKEGKLSSAAVVQTAGWELALLCQTCKAHPNWFADEPPLAPAWTPASVLKFDPSWVEVSADGARLEFGGGFHHYGYWVGTASPQSEGDAGPTTWILHFYSEDSPDRELGRFTLTPDDVLTQAEFVERTMTELDRRIAASRGRHGGGDQDASVQRCKFAIKHKQVARVQRAIRDTARQNENAWRDVLLAYLIDVPTDPAGADERLRQWAASKGDFAGWLMAAYAFDKAGDTDATEQAVLRACRFPANDPHWMCVNARAAGYPMCCRLYAAGKFDACIALCETLLAYADSGDYLAGSVFSIQNACRSAQGPAGPTTLPGIRAQIDSIRLAVSISRHCRRRQIHGEG